MEILQITLPHPPPPKGRGEGGKKSKLLKNCENFAKTNNKSSASSLSHHGLPDSIDTYGLVSGLWTSTFAFGAFIGPSISGLLYDSFGFRDSVIFIIALHIIVAFIILVTICTQRTPNPYKELGPSEPLLRCRDPMFYNERS